ncbi:unnamed protein product [Cochlearia groenlandica]
MATTKNILIIMIMATFSLTSYSLTTEQNKIATKIIQAMISGDSFEDWSEAFLNTNVETNGPNNILNATLFLPKTSVQEGLINAATSPLVASYHIVPQRLGFDDITLMKPLSRLPTLLYGNSIVVTNDSVSGFALDGVVITEPDLFVSPCVVIHRVASPFNLSRYGGDHDHMSLL